MPLSEAPTIPTGTAGSIHGVAIVREWPSGANAGSRPFVDLTCGDASRSLPRLVHRPRHRHTAAPGGIRLHIHEDPILSVSAGDGVFGHLMLGAPGRIRTCAHGSGGRCSIP